MATIIQNIDKETLEYIQQEYGRTKIELISKRTGLSIRKLRTVIEHHGFGSMYKNQGLVSRHAIAKAFQVKMTCVQKWTQSPKYQGVFPLVEIPPAIRQNEKNPYLKKKSKGGIDPEALWDWIYKNRDQIDLRKYIRYSLLPEPAWLENAIKQQQETFPPVTAKTRWSEKEDKELWYLFYYQEFSYEEIAQRLNRPKIGVQRRLKRLIESRKDNYLAKKAE